MSTIRYHFVRLHNKNTNWHICGGGGGRERERKWWIQSTKKQITTANRTQCSSHCKLNFMKFLLLYTVEQVPPYWMRITFNWITWLTFYRRFCYLSILRTNTFSASYKTKDKFNDFSKLIIKLQLSNRVFQWVIEHTHLAKIVVINSRVIFFFTLSGWATYHFCSRSLPCRLNNNMNSIIFAT